MLEITFLGTGAGVPSKDRAMYALAVRQGSQVTLFDCAEGTQRQLMISKLSFMKIDQIFITHLHGDHMLGLPGLIQTMGMSGRKDPLEIYGPKGIRNAIMGMLDACEGVYEYDLRIIEMEEGQTIRSNSHSVTSFPTKHGVPSLGFRYAENDSPGTFNKAKAISLGISPGPDFGRLQKGETVNGVTPEQVMENPRKGLSVVYTGDTVPDESVIVGSKDADLLIHDSTYDAGEEERAAKHMHSTCVQAAEVAKAASVRFLILTHFSHRYEDCTILQGNAREVFPDTFAVNDFDSFELTRSELRQV